MGIGDCWSPRQQGRKSSDCQPPWHNAAQLKLKIVKNYPRDLGGTKENEQEEGALRVASKSHIESNSSYSAGLSSTLVAQAQILFQTFHGDINLKDPRLSSERHAGRGGEIHPTGIWVETCDSPAMARSSAVGHLFVYLYVCVFLALLMAELFANKCRQPVCGSDGGALAAVAVSTSAAVAEAAGASPGPQCLSSQASHGQAAAHASFVAGPQLLQPPSLDNGVDHGESSEESVSVDWNRFIFFFLSSFACRSWEPCPVIPANFTCSSVGQCSCALRAGFSEERSRFRLFLFSFVSSMSVPLAWWSFFDFLPINLSPLTHQPAVHHQGAW